MSMTQYLLLFGILLMLIDIFFASDIPTYISYVLFTCAFSSILDLNVLVTIIFSIVFFFLLMIFHILIWRRTVSVLVNRVCAKDVYTPGIEGLVGSKGIVKTVSGKTLASIHGDLYQFVDDTGLVEGSTFTVKAVLDGKISV
ncbi:MAG: hypothetical protein JXK93_14280 [Sphaerochaetaceae bacterium]|nr:hypothetical protein [Sphaerochaetaceae bacterium]